MAVPARYGVVDQLEREWQPLVHGRIGSAFTRWHAAQPSLRRFERPNQLVRFLHSAAAAETDEPLLALLALAHDDTAAARLLLQALLPALKAQTQRLARRRVPHEEVWELLLFYAWTAIRAYPVARRPRAVAANLVLQIWHDTSRELDRCHRPPHSRPPCHLSARLLPRPAALGSWPDRSPRHGAFLVLAAVRAGVISRRDGALILRSRFQDVPLSVLAEQASVPYQSLVKRRQRAEQRLREWRHTQAIVQNRREKVLTSTAHPRRRPCQAAQRSRRACDRPRLDLKEGS
jgi:hypothetical protein